MQSSLIFCLLTPQKSAYRGKFIDKLLDSSRQMIMILVVLDGLLGRPTLPEIAVAPGTELGVTPYGGQIRLAKAEGKGKCFSTSLCAQSPGVRRLKIDLWFCIVLGDGKRVRVMCLVEVNQLISLEVY